MSCATTPASLSPSTRAVYDVVLAAGPSGLHVGQIRAAVNVSAEAVRQTLVRLTRDHQLVERIAKGVYRANGRGEGHAPSAPPAVVLVAEPADVSFRVPVVQIQIGDSVAYRVYIEPVETTS